MRRGDVGLDPAVVGRALRRVEPIAEPWPDRPRRRRPATGCASRPPAWPRWTGRPRPGSIAVEQADLDDVRRATATSCACANPQEQCLAEAADVEELVDDLEQAARRRSGVVERRPRTWPSTPMYPARPRSVVGHQVGGWSQSLAHRMPSKATPPLCGSMRNNVSTPGPFRKST